MGEELLDDRNARRKFLPENVDVPLPLFRNPGHATDFYYRLTVSLFSAVFSKVIHHNFKILDVGRRNSHSTLSDRMENFRSQRTQN